jgi:hypothetical protein
MRVIEGILRVGGEVIRKSRRDARNMGRSLQKRLKNKDKKEVSS